MKKLLTALLIILTLQVSSALAQCDKNFTVYGSSSEVAGSNTFARIVAAAGDVDNDGYPDFLVATTNNGTYTRTCKVTVYSGKTEDSIGTYFENGSQRIYNAEGFGDFNNDDYDDLLISGVIISGLAGDTLSDFSSVSRLCKNAGDIDKDGKNDLVFPANNYTETILISGANGDTLFTWGGGVTLVNAGDINNDTYPDIAIGNPSYSSDRGQVVVYSGFDGSQLFLKNGSASYVEFGYNIAAAGDLNNDNYDDIIICGQSENSVSAPLKVWAYSGQTGNMLYYVEGPGITYQDKFGYAMDGIGDINEDDRDDFIVAAYRDNSNEGNLFVYSGQNGSLIFEANIRFTKKEQFGYSVAGVGDTDGNGSPDFLVGAPNADDPDNPSQNNYFTGGAYLYRCLFPGPECQIEDDFDGDAWDNNCDNCLWFENVMQEDSNGNSIGEFCEQAGYLTVGAPKAFAYTKANWDWVGRDPYFGFDSVETADSIRFWLEPLEESISNINPIPHSSPMKYSLETEAGYLGPIEVRMIYLDTGLTTEEEEDLRLFQKIDGEWQNITTRNPLTNYNQIIGATYTVGEFAIGDCGSTPDSDGDGTADLCDNCPHIANSGQEDLDFNGIADACENSETAAAGSDTEVDIAIGDDSVSINFETVDTAGNVDFSVTTNGPATGANFSIVPSDPPKFYEITTNADYTGEITITLAYDDAGMTSEDEDSLRLWHYENYDWVDITIALDVANNLLTGVTTTLSPFAIGLPAAPLAVYDDEKDFLPAGFLLEQNHPNPFNPTTIIEYSLPHRTDVQISVYNILGQRVRNLLDDNKSAGDYSVIWDGLDEKGKTVSTGIYFYRIVTDNFTETKKMLLLK